jgi:hypothetical protein
VADLAHPFDALSVWFAMLHRYLIIFYMPKAGGVDSEAIGDIRLPCTFPALVNACVRVLTGRCKKPGYARTARPAGLRPTTVRLSGKRNSPWEQYFELVKVQNAHDRSRCRDHSGSEPWACENCDCTERLERKLATLGDSILKTLRDGSLRPTARACRE